MSNRPFKVRDKVRLREDSSYWGQSGEKNIGKITSDDGSNNLPYYVKWTGRAKNCYNANDLIMASVIYSEDHLKDKDIL